MSGSKALAQQLMRWATRRPPAGREDWALAMQREFDALEGDRLAWALGCFTTMTGWRLRADGLYLVLLALVPILLHLKSTLEFQLLMNGVISRSAYVDFLRSYGALWGVLAPLPIAVLLGAWRPHHLPTTLIVGCLIGQHVGGTLLNMSMVGGSFFSWWGPNATLYMAPPLVGLFASLAVWYIGASAGAHLRGRRHSV